MSDVQSNRQDPAAAASESVVSGAQQQGVQGCGSGAGGRALRVCHIITRMIIGGAQENTLLTVRGLREKGHNAVLLTGPTAGPEGRLLEDTPLSEDCVVEVPSLVRDLHPWKDVCARQWLVRYLRDHHFDVVHTHSSKAGILGRSAAAAAGVPVVIHTVHGQPFHPYQGGWRNRLYVLAERWAARRSTRILAVARKMVEQCVARGIADPALYEVVYSGMDLTPYLSAQPDYELRRDLGIPDDAPVVGKIARLFALKGHDYLLAAAPRIVERYPGVRFLLVGDGNRRKEIERLASEYGIADHVVFAGLVSPKEIPRYISTMDILVHLSLREGLPRTVVQALAAGVPAIGFDLDGTPEAVRDEETGIVCRPRDVEEVQRAVLRLLDNPEWRRQLGQNGRMLVRQRFDWRAMVDEIEHIYYRELRNVAGNRAVAL